jgi:hypothetical protein
LIVGDYDVLFLILFDFFLFKIAVGDQLLAQIELNNERRIQQTYKELVEKERQRMESEYREQCNELIHIWQTKLEDEKRRLQKV